MDEDHQQESVCVRAAAVAAAADAAAAAAAVEERSLKPIQADPIRPARIFVRVFLIPGKYLRCCRARPPLCRRVIPPPMSQFAGVGEDDPRLLEEMKEEGAARRGKWAPVRTPVRRLARHSHPSTEARAASPAAPAGVLFQRNSASSRSSRGLRLLLRLPAVPLTLFAGTSAANWPPRLLSSRAPRTHAARLSVRAAWSSKRRLRSRRA